MTQWKRPFSIVLGGALLALVASAWAPVASTPDPLPASTSGVAPSLYLKLDGLEGPLRDGSIPILSYRLSFAQGAASTRLSGGQEAGRVSMEDMILTKALDATSPLFALAVCEGRHWKEAKLTVAYGDPDKGSTLMEYALKDVMVSRYEVNSSPPGVSGTGEVLALRFGSIQWTYTDPDSKSKTETGWDLASNKGV